jgi:hypothetical protein
VSDDAEPIRCFAMRSPAQGVAELPMTGMNGESRCYRFSPAQLLLLLADGARITAAFNMEVEAQGPGRER